MLVLCAATSTVQAQQRPAKRVLLISTGTRLSPGFMIVDQHLRQALAAIPSAQIEMYAENLDLVRFRAGRYQRIFTDYLAEKYAEHPPDLVILFFVGSLGIPVQALERLFPRTPIIVAGLSEEALRPEQFGHLVSGFAQRVDPHATLELMLRLQPHLRRVVVVSGTAEIDREVLQRIRQAAQSFKGRLDIEFWDNLRMEDLHRAVTTLPPETAVLVGRMFRDAAGQAFISSEVSQWIGQWANAPVYVMSDASLGTGAVGGAVASIEAFSKRAGEMARLILAGTAPASMPFEVRTDTVPMFDWRALKRWGISERLLPADSVIRFRPPSMWEQYDRYIIGALIIFIAQSALIVALVLQRRQRRRIQAVLQESQRLMELATSAGELGLWSRDAAGGEVWANAPMRALFGFGAHDTIRSADLVARLHPDDRAPLVAEIERTQAAGLPFEGEFRTRLPDGTERWVLAKGRTLTDPGGRATRRLGVILDITQRKRAEQKLRESEDNLRRLIESTSVVIWQADPESWVFTYVSPYAVKLLGYPLERWYEKDFWISHIHPDDREQAVETCLTLSRTTNDFAFDYRMIRSSGEVVWIHDIVNVQHQNNSTQLRGLMFDITERRQRELALRESEDRFRTMANSVPVMIWMSGPDRLCTFFSNGWLAFTGRKLEQALGNGWTESVHKEDVERCIQMYKSAFDARRELGIEYRLRRADGEYRNVLDHGVPRFEPDGTFLGYIGTCIDVTELKRAEESLDKQRAFLRQILDINPNFIFAKDREGRFTLANQAVADAYGVTVADLIGKTDADFDPDPDEVEHFRRIDLEVMDTLQERFIPEERITDAQGNVRWLQTVKRPIIESDGTANQVLGASTDITLRKKTEMELQEQRAALAHVARVSLMGELSASLAHELNQPLTAIRSNANAALRFLTRETVDLEEVRGALEDIVQADARAAEVIRRTRVLVTKEGELEFATLDLASVISDVLALVHSDAIMEGVRIVVRVDQSLPPVRGDRVQLQQVMLNLLLNAFDAIRESAASERAVELRVERQDEGMNRVAVRDRGPGLTADALEKIFEPFYTTKREGLGMGLSICRSIIEAHGGTLWATNNPDGGATFYFTLPIEPGVRA